MKTNEILQGNRILAEFMGLKPGYNSYTGKYNWSDGIFFMTDGETIEDVMDAIVGYAKYHSSWDWLMPVVEKILNICQESDEMEEYYIITDAIPEIESVFSACVTFAEWYKKQ